MTQSGNPTLARQWEILARMVFRAKDLPARSEEEAELKRLLDSLQDLLVCIEAEAGHQRKTKTRDTNKGALDAWHTWVYRVKQKRRGNTRWNPTPKNQA